MKKRVAILFGGCSSEYEVSLKSATAVIENMNSDKYEMIFIGITKQGHWYHYSGLVNKIAEDTWQEGECYEIFLNPNRGKSSFLEKREQGWSEIAIDVVFPVLHGKNGEDGTLQGFLELANIPYVGCDSLSSAICMNKNIAHQLVKDAGILVTKSVVLEDDTKGMEKVKELQYPLYVKPIKAGSSIGITKVEREEELEAAVKEAFLYDDKVMIEENVEGFEVGCAVLGNGKLLVGEIDEIELTKDFFNYTEKYELLSSKIHLPARLSKEVREEIQEKAKKIYKILGCKGFARVDLFYTPKGELVFNEVNTIPGFTSHSRYPSMLSYIGMTYTEILEQLIALA